METHNIKAQRCIHFKVSDISPSTTIFSKGDNVKYVKLSNENVGIHQILLEVL